MVVRLVSLEAGGYHPLLAAGQAELSRGAGRPRNLNWVNRVNYPMDRSRISPLHLNRFEIPKSARRIVPVTVRYSFGIGKEKEHLASNFP